MPRGSIREDPSTIPLLRSVYCNGDENQLVDCLNNGKGEKDDEERDDEDCQSVPIRCDGKHTQPHLLAACAGSSVVEQLSREQSVMGSNPT